MIKELRFSKTVLFNILTFIVAVLELTEVIDFIPDAYNGLLALITAVVNLALRMFFTAQPITKYAAMRAYKAESRNLN